MKKLFFIISIAFLLASCGQGRSEGKIERSEKELASSRMITVEEGNDAKVVVEDGVVKSLPRNGKPSLLDFTATWCGPCKMMKPVFEELEDTYDGSMNFVSIDIDLNPELASRYGIRAVPTFVFIDEDGTPVKVVEGAVAQETLENQINRMIKI